MRRFPFIASALLAATWYSPVNAFLASGCLNSHSSASDIASALKKCDSANYTLKDNACNFGGAAMAEFWRQHVRVKRQQFRRSSAY